MPERVGIKELTVGMYLVGIDKPWVHTPFLRHHFKISSEAQIAKLKACGVNFVDIDPTRGLPCPEPPSVHESAPESRGVQPDVQPDAQNESLAPPTPLSPEPSETSPTTRIRRADSAEGRAEFTGLLRVRMLMQLAFPSLRQHTLSTTRLLGWSDRNFLLTELPFHEGRAIEFRPRSLCIVRFVETGRVFGFKTETMRGQFSPIPLLFLAFPQEIEELCLRRTPRIPVALKTRVHLGVGMDDRLDGVIRDLSLSGCRLELIDPSLIPVQGADVQLDLHLPGAQLLEGIPGLIRNVSVKPPRAETHPTKVLLGIEFAFLPSDPAAPAAVERYVNEHLAEPSETI